MKKAKVSVFTLKLLIFVALSISITIGLYNALWTNAHDTETYFTPPEGGRQEFDCVSKGYNIHCVAQTRHLSDEGSCLFVKTPFDTQRKVYVTTEIINLNGHKQDVQASIYFPDGTTLVEGSLKVNGIARVTHESPAESDDFNGDIIATTTKSNECIILEYAFTVDPTAFAEDEVAWIRNDLAINSELVSTIIGLQFCNTAGLLKTLARALIFVLIYVGYCSTKFFKNRKKA